MLDALGNAYIIEQGSSGEVNGSTILSPIYYRVWSNGFVEQWQDRQSNNNSVTFPIEFNSTEYVLIGVGVVLANTGGQYRTKTTTGFSVKSEGVTTTTFAWYACGYKA